MTALQVFVTRPADQAAEWVGQLARHGVRAQALPLLSIQSAADPSAVAAAWQALPDCKLVMFVSPNAATQFFALRPTPGPWPASVQVASPGPGTSAGLRALGVPAGQITEPAPDAEQFDSEALWQQLRHSDWRGADVLVVSGEDGRDWLARQLQEQGARVRRLAAYRRTPPDWTPGRQALLEQALAQPRGHLWFFSSSQAVHHLLEHRPAPAWRASRALATHPRIAQAARDAGFGEVRVCRPTLEAVVACIQSSANAASP